MNGLRIVCACSIVLFASAVFAEEDTTKAPAVPADLELNERVEKSVERACQWLAKNQGHDGALKSQYTCAATGLAGLAWLAAGSTPSDGPYSKNINLAIDYLVKCSTRNGFISENGGFGASGMYGHGFATQFLAEVHGMIPDQTEARRVKETCWNARSAAAKAARTSTAAGTVLPMAR